MPTIPPPGRLLLVALALLTALPAAAQDDPPVVNPGSDLLDLSRLRPDTTTFTVTAVQGDMRQQLGTYTRTLSIDEAAGVAEAVSEMNMMGQKFADTTRVAWPSLAARYHYSDNPQRRLVFSVEDGVLAGEHTPSDGDAASFELPVSGPVFDSSWIDDLARALPLAEGYAVTIPAYSYEAGGVADHSLRVVGSEKLTRQGKAPVDVWVVEPSRPGEDQGALFYLTKQGHDLVRIRIEPQPGVEVLIDAQ